MSDAVTLAVGVLTATTLAVGLMSALVHKVILPWIIRHVVDPVKQTNHQVTVNRHISNTPTLLDKVDTIQSAQIVAARMFEGHMDWSEEESARLWNAIGELRERQNG